MFAQRKIEEKLATKMAKRMGLKSNLIEERDWVVSLGFEWVSSTYGVLPMCRSLSFWVEMAWVWRLGWFGLFGFVKFRGFEWIGFGDLVGLD